MRNMFIVAWTTRCRDDDALDWFLPDFRIAVRTAHDRYGAGQVVEIVLCRVFGVEE